MGKEAVVYIYNGILLSHKINDDILPFVTTWMDLEDILLRGNKLMVTSGEREVRRGKLGVRD